MVEVPDMSEEATKKVQGVIWKTTIASAALGVVFSPIPLVDEILLVPIYGVMTARIGKARGIGVSKVPWRPLGTAIFAGLAARAAANIGFAFIPGVAAVANALSAAALTKVLGEYADTTFRDGAVPPMPFQRKSAKMGDPERVPQTPPG
jgi:uncharacterized protein (DUF697 family)